MVPNRTGIMNDNDDRHTQIIVRIDPEHLKVIDSELKRLSMLLADPNLPQDTKAFVQDRIKDIHSALLPKAQ